MTADTGPLRGEIRRPGGTAVPGSVVLGREGLTVAVEGAAPWSVAYRDCTLVAVDAGTVLLGIGDGAADRWLLERFGTRAGALALGLRDGRLRQRLADGLVALPPDAEIDLVEYEAAGGAGAETGVAQLVYHDRGAVLAPLLERHPWRRVRRSDVGAVRVEPAVGGVAIEGAGRSLPAGPGGSPALRLLRLGGLAQRHRDRWVALAAGAAADAAAIVAGLIPDADVALRLAAAEALLEGRPRSPEDLGPAWPVLERAALGQPPFDESYRALCAVGGPGAGRWLVAAPERPGSTDAPRLWFLVGLPGNLVAMELVSAGAHATYLFRVVPRADFTGAVDAGALGAAVGDVSEALLDARFLREPMALPAPRLAEPAALRYRLALAALPSLAAARRRFVARIAHRDPASWRAALDDLVAWHGGARDDAAEWPGRAAQEAQVDEAGSGSG